MDCLKTDQDIKVIEKDKFSLAENILRLNEAMNTAYVAKKAIEKSMGLHRERGRKPEYDVPAQVGELLKEFNRTDGEYFIEGIDDRVFVVWPLDACFFYKLEKRIFVYVSDVLRKNSGSTEPLQGREKEAFKSKLSTYLEGRLEIGQVLRAIGARIVIQMPGDYED